MLDQTISSNYLPQETTIVIPNIPGSTMQKNVVTLVNWLFDCCHVKSTKNLSNGKEAMIWPLKTERENGQRRNLFSTHKLFFWIFWGSILDQSTSLFTRWRSPY